MYESHFPHWILSPLNIKGIVLASFCLLYRRSAMLISPYVRGNEGLLK